MMRERTWQGLPSSVSAEGVVLAGGGSLPEAELAAWLAQHQLLSVVDVAPLPNGEGIRLTLKPHLLAAWLPGGDALGLRARLNRSALSLVQEIILCLLASPVAMRFPSLAELDATIEARAGMVDVGLQTRLAFRTDAAERPAAFWSYTPGEGFTLRPGVDLIASVRAALLPEVADEAYDFSCYRASEYVVLAGMLPVIARVNPPLYAALEAQWRQSPIMSGPFHDTFLREYGSADAPVPPGFYIPGDRVWFRNPDERSADVSGFEGSWVIYLGSGVFTNLWDPTQPFDLTRKAVEIYHWRDGVVADDRGEWVMDEARVAQEVEKTLACPDRLLAILERMLRYRDGRGIYADGGCLDTTREAPRWMSAGVADIHWSA